MVRPLNNLLCLKHNVRALVQLGGLEPPTSCSTDRRSNQLSYNCILCRAQEGVPNPAETRCNAWLWQGREMPTLASSPHAPTDPPSRCDASQAAVATFGFNDDRHWLWVACVRGNDVKFLSRAAKTKARAGRPGFFGSETAAWIRRPA